MKRFILALTVVLAACTSYDKPLVMPELVRLQDPLPGGAVVYLLTGPHDGASYEVYAGDKLLAKLGAGRYTVLFLAAGPHTLVTKSGGFFSRGSEEAPPLRLDLKAGERLFFNISGQQGSSPTLLFGPKGSVVYVGSDMVTASGTRTWKPCTELDAQGLMSILKFAMPEP